MAVFIFASGSRTLSETLLPESFRATLGRCPKRQIDRILDICLLETAEHCCLAWSETNDRKSANRAYALALFFFSA